MLILAVFCGLILATDNRSLGDEWRVDQRLKPDWILSQIEAAIAQVKSFDLIYSVRRCVGPHRGTIPSTDRIEPLNCETELTESFHDRYDSLSGRRIHWLDSEGLPVALALHRQSDDQLVKPDHLDFLGSGRDYLTYLHPREGSIDLITALKQHPQTRVLRSDKDPHRLMVEIPFRALWEFDEFGMRVWCDSHRGFMPTRFDVYIRIGDREVLTARTDVELTEVAPGVHAPLHGVHTRFVTTVDVTTGEGAVQVYRLRVDQDKSSWNSPLSQAELSSPLLTDRAFRVDDDVRDGWILAVPAFDEFTRAGPPSRWLYVIVISANLLIILLAALLWYCRWTANPRDGGSKSAP